VGLFDRFFGKKEQVSAKDLHEVETWTEIAKRVKPSGITVYKQVWSAFNKSGWKKGVSKESTAHFIEWLGKKYWLKPSHNLKRQISFMLDMKVVKSATDVYYAFGEDDACKVMKQVAGFFKRPIRLSDVRIYLHAVLGVEYEKGKVNPSISSHIKKLNFHKHMKLIRIDENMLCEYINADISRMGSGVVNWRSLTEVVRENIKLLDDHLPETELYDRARAAIKKQGKAHSQRVIINMNDGDKAYYNDMCHCLLPLYLKHEHSDRKAFVELIHTGYDVFY